MESCPTALLELGLHRRWFVPWIHSPEGKGFAGQERRQGGLLQGRALHWRGSHGVF